MVEHNNDPKTKEQRKKTRLVKLNIPIEKPSKAKTKGPNML